MANPEHLKIAEKGLDALLEWRMQNEDVVLDLSEVSVRHLDLGPPIMSKFGGRIDPVNLQRADLSDMRLQNIYLRNSNLQNACMDRTNLKRANLAGSDLRGASLHFADLYGAELYKADLRGSRLTGAILNWAHFTCTKLDGAVFGDSSFGSVRFKGCSGLETAKHQGPSAIGIDTILECRAELPDIFLRGCGVPEQFITYARSLLGQAIEFYSCFISYSTHEQEFADRLYADLQNKGIRCWFAPEDLKIGDRFRQRIDEAIRLHDKLLLILTEHSVRSDWVREEVESCLEREHRERRMVLFPVRLDDAVMETNEAWAASIRRQRHMGDFRAWKDHDAYQKAFERLMRDLKTDGSTENLGSS